MFVLSIMWILSKEGFESKIFSLLANFYWAAFLEEQVPIWFLLDVSSFALPGALKMLSVKTTVKMWCFKMALKKDDNVSSGLQGNEESSENCPSAGHHLAFAPVLGNSVLNPSDGYPALWKSFFPCSGKIIWVVEEEKVRVFTGMTSYSVQYFITCLVYVQPVPWVSGAVSFPVSVRLKQTESVACGLCESLLMSAILRFARW